MRFILSCAAFILAMTAPAYAQIPGLGQITGIGRGDPPASVLAAVRAGEYTERCATEVGDEAVPDEEMYDLVDLWTAAVGPAGGRTAAPDGARFNHAPAGLDRADWQLNQLLAQLKAVQPPPEGIVVDAVIDPDRNVDARQTSNGRITLSLGLMDILRQRPAERRMPDTMFILAHEYAHVLLCHYTGRMARARNARTLRTASMVGLLVVAAGNTRADRTANGITLSSTGGDRAGNQMLTMLAGMTLLRSANSVIVNPSWGRREERDADGLAVELMREAGVTTAYVGELLIALREADEASGEQTSQIMAAVPAQTLSAFALSLQENSTQSLRDRLTLVAVNAGVQAFQQWRRNQLRHFHDPPQRRINGYEPILALRDQQFADADRQRAEQNAQSGDVWQQAFDTSFDNDRRVLTLAQQADEQFMLGQFDQACALATQAIEAERDDFRALMAMARCDLHRGQTANAERRLNRAMDSPNAMPSDYASICALWREEEERARAEAALQRGTSRFPGRFFTDFMYLHADFRDYDRVTVVAQECASADVPDPTKQECVRTQQELQRQQLREQQEEAAAAAAAAAGQPVATPATNR